MLHFELSLEQQKKHQKILLASDRIAQQAESISSEKRDYIALQSLISNIGASTRIENALLTDIEIEWMDTIIKTEPHFEYANREKFIKDKLAKDKSRSIEEVAGYRNALQLVFSTPEMFTPLSVSALKGLHREMLRYHGEAQHHLGDFKTVPNTVLETDGATGQSRPVLKTADPGILTETSMMDLVDWYNREIHANPFTVAVAVEFVFRFLAIHPFQDGNGRISRLCFQLALMAPVESVFTKSVPLCAVDRAIEQTRKKYYQVLQRCSEGIFRPDPSLYQYRYLLDYMLEILTVSLKNFEHYGGKYDRYQALPHSAVRVLDCFKNQPEHPLATRQILANITMPRRTVIYSLNALMEAGFLQRTGKGAGSLYRLVF